MNEKNRNSQPFIMVFCVTVIMIGLSQFSTETYLFGYQTKKISPLSDIILIGEAKKVPLPYAIVNNALKAKDSAAIALREIDPSNIVDFKKDSVTTLAYFFKALNELKKHKRKVRIGYFGDSMIEGDLITQDVRGCLQDAFGGEGVGYVPITSIVAGFRTSIIHSYEGWTTYNLLDESTKGHLLGISGYGFVPAVEKYVDSTSDKSATWVKYTAVNRKHINKFHETKLLYGKGNDGNYVVINGRHYKLNEKKQVNELMINNGTGCQCINAKFQCKNPIDIFGFTMESDSGVFVDNFSFRGNSGMPITKVTQSVYSGTNDCLNYDLIILEYGLNVVNPRVTDFSWYVKGMTNTIKHIQASFPNASILLISVGDKGYRKEGEYQTDPSVPILVATQKTIAEKNNLAFWSLYDAMGGNGAMVKWVEGDTVLANKDYTHFNFKGAHKVGKLLFNKLMSEYSDYNKKKNRKHAD